MSNLSNARMYGGIGALLMLVGGFIPAVGGIIPLIGLILVFIAVKSIANETNDESIFKNYLWYFVVSIVAMVVVFGIFIASFGAAGGFSILNMMQMQGGQTVNPEDITSLVGNMMGGCLAALVIGWILMIVATLFLRKSFNSIAEHTGVKLFATTGLLFFVGAITLVILVGGILLLIAAILEIVAFFSLPETLPKAATASTAEG
ncbi:MAG TPA: DUF996 domain-containing protein [Thermoplasmatales archaeon]|nr:DUF996 domain-containing protein [Thermoplasmatales archaeon]